MDSGVQFEVGYPNADLLGRLLGRSCHGARATSGVAASGQNTYDGRCSLAEEVL